MEKKFFFILGAQKSGTTYLTNLLCKHPEVCMPKQKEVHYFTRNFHRGEEWYWRQFREKKGANCFGEATPNYLAVNYPEYAAVSKRIQQTLPGAKFIIVLRNPVDRAISAYKHHLVRGRFGKHISVEEDFHALLNANISTAGIIEFGYYYKQLSHYFELFDPSQFLILIYEKDICRDMQNTMMKIYRFLEIDPGFGLPSIKNRKNIGIRSALAAKFAARISQFMTSDETRMRFGGYIQQGCVFAEKLLPMKPLQVSVPVRRLLESLYKEDTRQLADFLHCNGPIWVNKF